MTKVTVRTQEVKGGKLSIYLDFYPPIQNSKGKQTRREFLKLYAHKTPKTRVEKQHNQTVLNQAATICLERQKQIDDGSLNNHKKVDKDITLIKLLEDLYYSASHSESTKKLYGFGIQKLKEFLESNNLLDMKVYDVDKAFCNKYREYILQAKMMYQNKPISHNTKSSYFNTFLRTLKKAYELDYISTNVVERVKIIGSVETKKEFLTLDELQTLAKTSCSNEEYKNAALFSALTGLRFSDVKKLKWGDVVEENGEYTINFKQKKTKDYEVLPISAQAYKLLGTKCNDEDVIFGGLSLYINKTIKKWVQDAGINKKITFHCFRHTFATLQLKAGTDIYTVSKMLGHKDLKTTQVYAKVVDSSKRDASKKINIDI